MKELSDGPAQPWRALRTVGNIDPSPPYSTRGLAMGSLINGRRKGQARRGVLKAADPGDSQRTKQQRPEKKSGKEGWR